MIPEPIKQEPQALENLQPIDTNDDNIDFFADERVRKPKGKKIRKMRYFHDR